MISKIDNIIDPYTAQTFQYQYDDMNRPCGYSVNYSPASGAMAVEVKQIGASETRYRYGLDTRISKVDYEDVYLEPRIYSTQDSEYT